MAERNNYSEVTPEIVRLAEMSREAGVIDTALFTKYDVKRGLRDLNGKGGRSPVYKDDFTIGKDGVPICKEGFRSG